MDKKRPVGQRSTEWHEAKARATKAAVLSGAARVFDRVGYRNAVVSEISKESQTTAGAMYHYFPSKQAVALAVMEEFQAQLLPIFDVRIEGSGIQELVGSVSQLCDRWREDPVFRAGTLMTFEPGFLPQEQLELRQKWEAAVGGAIANAQDSGEIAKDHDSISLAKNLISSLVGAWTVTHAADGTDDLQQTVGSTLRLFLDAVTIAVHREIATQAINETFPTVAAIQ